MRENHAKCVKLDRSEAIMVRTKLRIPSSKIKAKEIRKATMCNEIIVFHFCEKVRDYYNNLNEKNICDNRKFWKVVKPLLSNKIASNEKIAIVEWEEII